MTKAEAIAQIHALASGLGDELRQALLAAAPRQHVMALTMANAAEYTTGLEHGYMQGLIVAFNISKENLQISSPVVENGKTTKGEK